MAWTCETESNAEEHDSAKSKLDQVRLPVILSKWVGCRGKESTREDVQLMYIYVLLASQGLELSTLPTATSRCDLTGAGS